MWIWLNSYYIQFDIELKDEIDDIIVFDDKSSINKTFKIITQNILSDDMSLMMKQHMLLPPIWNNCLNDDKIYSLIF